VIADALGGMLQLAPVPSPAGPVVLLFAGMVLENRARVVVIASSGAGPRGPVAWAAALRHPAALAYAVVAMVEVLVPYLGLAVVAIALLFGRIWILARQDGVSGVAFGAGLAVVFAIAALLFVTALLVALAGVAATFDTVAERRPPHHALAWWLRETFRRRSLGATLVAGLIFIMLVGGVPLTLGWLFTWGPAGVRSVLFAIPEGIADAIALNFVWYWREAIVEGRHGRDIQALLDGAVQPVLTVSPSASSPGVTTSQ
jgi:hypothetical protein